MKTNLLLASIAWIVVAAPSAWAQRGIEVTPFIGGQTNGGLDLSTALYNRIDIQNGLNYGVSVGYLISKHASVEFMWNHNHADTLAHKRRRRPEGVRPQHQPVSRRLFGADLYLATHTLPVRRL